jgi:hypothetical protein
MPITVTKYAAIASKQVKNLPGVLSVESFGQVTSLEFKPTEKGHGLKVEFDTASLESLKAGQVVAARAVKTTGRIPCVVSVTGSLVTAKMEGKGHDWAINVETSGFLP